MYVDVHAVPPLKGETPSNRRGIRNNQCGSPRGTSSSRPSLERVAGRHGVPVEHAAVREARRRTVATIHVGSIGLIRSIPPHSSHWSVFPGRSIGMFEMIDPATE